jgi:TonB family protein
MNTLLYQSNSNRRFAAALVAAVIIHVAAIGFATTKPEAPSVPSGPNEDPFIEIVTPDPIPDPPTEQLDPLPTPPVIDQSFVDEKPTPPPVHRTPTKFTPATRRSNLTTASSVNVSTAKVLALNTPRPEYPYEARRHKITGNGVVVMSVDSGSGNVTAVTMVRSTGNAFLDNAAIAGFRRWRFKPGSVSTVTCPVTFTLAGADY